MNSRGEIEAAISQGIAQFEQDNLGRGTAEIHAYSIDQLIVVRLHGVLTAAEKHLVKMMPPD